MAEFATFITDPDLEIRVIRAIHQSGGVVAIRGVSAQQIAQIDPNLRLTLLCNKAIAYSGNRLLIKRESSDEEISELISSSAPNNKPQFRKNGGKVFAFVGLSGGVGTTSLALNFAFELSQQSAITLIDLDPVSPDIARLIGLHRIDERPEILTKNLTVMQGLDQQSSLRPSENYVFDLGHDHNSQILEIADEIFLVMRLATNTLDRLKQVPFNPTGLIVNFMQRSKYLAHLQDEIKKEFPRLKHCQVPIDFKAFEEASENRSALHEVARNSLARKSIATLTQCAYM